jgi:Rrf2 family iron-sulfur cluster assembly transcriptional regulator
MQLSAKGRYAVTAMGALARAGGAPLAASEIAENEHISAPFLDQLMTKLRRAGLVEGVRGPGGGYRLADAPERITIAAILEAVDERVAATGCRHDAAPCTGTTERCLSHDLWAAFGRHIAGFLHTVTLADLSAGRFPGVDARGLGAARPMAQQQAAQQ